MGASKEAFVPINQNIMKKQGKKYVAAAKLVDSKQMYDVDSAIEILKKTSTTKFDSSCEIHVNLNIDPRMADQLVRSTVVLPKGTGKDVKVVAFVSDDMVKEATAAGAMKAGLETLIEEVMKGFTDFDIAVATPDAMKSMGKIAKTLGTKGLMPSPKAGTVTTEIAKTIGEIKKGKVEIKNDKFGQLHNVFGKVSFNAGDLKENLVALLKAIYEAKPAAVKSTYVKSISLATSMGPGVKLDLTKVAELVK